MGGDGEAMGHTAGVPGAAAGCPGAFKTEALQGDRKAERKGRAASRESRVAERKAEPLRGTAAASESGVGGGIGAVGGLSADTSRFRRPPAVSKGIGCFGGREEREPLRVGNIRQAADMHTEIGSHAMPVHWLTHNACVTVSHSETGIWYQQRSIASLCTCWSRSLISR